VGAPLSVLVALAAALLVNSRLTKWPTFFRTAYFAPFVTTLVAVADRLEVSVSPPVGLLDAALGAVGIAPVDWLGDPTWAMPAIIIVAVWRSFGYNMLIFVAGLQRIPVQLYEAAELDGAGSWARLRHVTLPQLAPTFVFVGVITAIGFFQLFAEPYVMTQGGPLKSTLSMVLYMYEEGFRWWRWARQRRSRSCCSRLSCRSHWCSSACRKSARREAALDVVRVARRLTDRRGRRALPVVVDGVGLVHVHGRGQLVPAAPAAPAPDLGQLHGALHAAQHRALFPEQRHRRRYRHSDRPVRQFAGGLRARQARVQGARAAVQDSRGGPG